MGYYVYKYVQNNKVIYIGQTTDLDRRINEHTRDKLKNFRGEVYFFECTNKTSMDSWEYMLINKYHPQYNIVLNNPKETVNIEEPKWKLYLAFGGEEESKPTSNIIDLTNFISKNKTISSSPILKDDPFSNNIRMKWLPQNQKTILFRCKHCKRVFKTSLWRKTKKGYSSQCPDCPYAVWAAG